jgi:hypothetical protein
MDSSDRIQDSKIHPHKYVQLIFGKGTTPGGKTDFCGKWCGAREHSVSKRKNIQGKKKERNKKGKEGGREGVRKKENKNFDVNLTPY